MVSLEIELKLRIAPADVDQVSTHPVIVDFGEGEPSQYQISNIYFDTPNFDLKQHGYALRVRQVAGKILQTVKSAGVQHGDLYHRQEWEQEIFQPIPDVTLVPDESLRELLMTVTDKAPLLPHFETKFLRTNWDLLLPDVTKIEFSLDQGVVQTDNLSEPICELELELKTGDSNKLYEIADALRKTIPLTVELRSKAERGYWLCML